MEKRRRRRNIKPKKTWVQKCKDCLRQFIAFLFSNVGIICLVVGYTLAGAFIFMSIEGDASEAQKKNFSMKFDGNYNVTLNNLWNIMTTTVSLDNTEVKNKINLELVKFQNVVVTAVKVDDYDGNTIYSERWSIYAAFLYCLTVITTIGYGNIFPHSCVGKGVTIVYAIFGMPLFLLYLSNIGDLLAKSFKWLYAKFCLCKICRSNRRRPVIDPNAIPTVSPSNSWRNTMDKTWTSNTKLERRPGEMTEAEDSDDENTKSSETSSSSSSGCSKELENVTVPITLCLAIMIGFISAGALLFGSQEELNFLDGSYFCFISLSTIGFGDIVPSIKNKTKDFKLNFVFCSIYLMLGMALIAMCFNLMQQDVVQKMHTCKEIFKRIARCRR